MIVSCVCGHGGVWHQTLSNDKLRSCHFIGCKCEQFSLDWVIAHGNKHFKNKLDEVYAHLENCKSCQKTWDDAAIIVSTHLKQESITQKGDNE